MQADLESESNPSSNDDDAQSSQDQQEEQQSQAMIEEDKTADFEQRRSSRKRVQTRGFGYPVQNANKTNSNNEIDEDDENPESQGSRKLKGRKKKKKKSIQKRKSISASSALKQSKKLSETGKPLGRPKKARSSDELPPGPSNALLVAGNQNDNESTIIPSRIPNQLPTRTPKQDISPEQLDPDYFDPNSLFINAKFLFDNYFARYRPKNRPTHFSEPQFTSQTEHPISEEALDKQTGDATAPSAAGIEAETPVRGDEEILSVNTGNNDIIISIDNNEQQAVEEEQEIESNGFNNINENSQKESNNENNNNNQIKLPIGVDLRYSEEYKTNMIELQRRLDQVHTKFYPSRSYVNGDLRYFNLDILTQATGKFDIVYMDPPWRIKGGQQYDSQFMFSNSKFSLEYDTMSNKEITDIAVERLSDSGFLFLWILNTQMNIACEQMQKWGYNLVDKIVWVKMKDKNVYLSHGYYFMHSYEICLVGYKNSAWSKASNTNSNNNNNPSTTKNDCEMRAESADGTAESEAAEPTIIDSRFSEFTTEPLQPQDGGNGSASPNMVTPAFSPYPQTFNKISNNVIFADVRKKSQKPDDIYEIIDMLMPGAKKIELFARNNNLRPGWVSLGNQLGELYDKWTHEVSCDSCLKSITKGKTERYKSRKQANFDLCEFCFEASDEYTRDEFFKIENKVTEDILHNYQKCNRCESEPIWGIRFQCKVCKDFDLCEGCVDENISLQPAPFHDISHPMKIIEVPIFADGFPAHDCKCSSCFQFPIIGACFSCKQCVRSFNLCQNCYFNKPMEKMTTKRHRADHHMEALVTPVKTPASKQTGSKKKKSQFSCNGCGILRQETMYKCDNCYSFFFCEKCFETKKDDFKSFLATTHKSYHSLVPINFNADGEEITVNEQAESNDVVIEIEQDEEANEQEGDDDEEEDDEEEEEQEDDDDDENDQEGDLLVKDTAAVGNGNSKKNVPNSTIDQEDDDENDGNDDDEDDDDEQEEEEDENDDYSQKKQKESLTKPKSKTSKQIKKSSNESNENENSSAQKVRRKRRTKEEMRMDQIKQEAIQSVHGCPPKRKRGRPPKSTVQNGTAAINTSTQQLEEFDE